MNQVQLNGNLSRDPEIRYTATGKPVAAFNIAASTTYVDAQTKEAKEQTAFINCVAWNKLAEGVGNLRKGDRCFVEGRLSVRSYETKDGQKRYVTEVIANFVGTGFDVAGVLGGATGGPSSFESMASQNDADEQIPF